MQHKRLFAALGLCAAAALSLGLAACEEEEQRHDWTGVPVTSITLSAQSLLLEVGQTQTLKATVLPENATDKTLTWTTDNASVATVSGGTVTAVAVGEAVITAAWEDVIATCTVAVADEVISTAQELTAFAQAVNGGNDYAGRTVALGSDIDLAEEDWTPVGNGARSDRSYKGNAFKGTFDGRGYTIGGLHYNGTYTENEDSAFGLFGVLDGGTVKNVTFADVSLNITNSECAGTAVGLVVNGGTVSGVTVSSGSLTAVRGNGGIVGRMCDEGSIENCVNRAAIASTSANSGNVGGIVGAAYYTANDKDMTISGCENYGKVTAACMGAGGIVGLSSANISGCTNAGAVTGNGASIGGIVGEQQNYGSVTGCTNTANISNLSENYGTGGIVGWIRYSGSVENYQMKAPVTVKECLNTGAVDGGSDGGGIVGTVYNNALIEDCMSTAASVTGTTFAAGIVGNMQKTETVTVEEGDDAIANRILVTHCCSTTPEAEITAVNTDLYAYDNDSADSEMQATENYAAVQAWQTAGFGAWYTA